MKLNKRAQAALEFLMTYGWAILVVLVAIGTLAYFGVLNPEKFLPSKCTLPPGFACSDHKASATGVSLALRNALGYDVNSVVVAVGGCGASSTTTFSNGEQKTITIACTLVSGNKLNADVNVSYNNVDSTLSHKVQGSIITKVE